MNRIALIVLLLGICLSADEVYTKNKKANRLYEKEKYDEAHSIYEDALLASPENKKLSMNKGSALFRMQELEKAKECYDDALSIDDEEARADLHYNMGNLLNAQGDQQMMTGGQEAMEKLKAARDSYIKALDIRPSDKDAKWNLEITQQKIKQLEKQQQQQKQDNKDNKDNKDQKSQDKNQNKKDDKKEQDKKDQNKDEQKKDQKEEQKDQQQQNQNDEQKKEEQKKQPKPEKSDEEMKKQEALRLLGQYADDANELNKPKKKVLIGKVKKPEKDW